MRKRTLPIILALTCLGMPGAAAAATWYVDKDATGTGTGTSWANAWKTFAAITWTAIKPGDTIYVSGGYYPESIRAGAGGTSGNPIRIKASQEAGHNDKIITRDIGGTGLANWVVFDGAKSDNVTFTNTYQVQYLDTNCNWTITNDAGSLVVFGSKGSGVGVTLRWLDIGPGLTGVNGHHGIFINVGDYDDFVVEYCHIHDTETDGIQIAGNATFDFDDITVRWCLFERIGDDMIEGQPGTTVYHSIFRDSEKRHGHPDGMAGPTGYARYYNNIYYDLDDRPFYLLLWETAPETQNHVYIYGNLIYTDNYTNRQPEAGIVLGWETQRPDVPAQNTWTNLVVVNNTVIGGTAPGDIQSGFLNSNMYGVTNDTILKNIVVKNNIVLDMVDGGILGNNAALNGFVYAQSDYQIDYNIVCSPTAEGRIIRYQATNYPSAAVFSAATAYTHNSTNRPVFVDASRHNYCLATNDTAARNRGQNLASLNLPGWSVDLLGNPRVVNGAVSIGAIAEASFSTNPPTPTLPPPTNNTEGLLVWLKFDDSFDDGVLDDSSGNGRHAYRFGRPDYPTNWPVRVSEAAGPGRTKASGFAGEFRWFNDDWGLYGKSGYYAGVTNVSALTNMPRATIAVWARYYSATRIDPAYDHSQDQNASLLTVGMPSGTVGTWKLGRWYSGETVFTVLTNGNYTYDRLLKFPDPAYTTKGDTLKWNHYAVTFDNGQVSAYFNGQPFTNITMTVTALKMGKFPHAPYWLGIGTDTHAGTPPLEDETGEDYPNHGWFNGVMDDVRIYNRVLSAAEIAGIYSELVPPSGLKVVPPPNP